VAGCLVLKNTAYQGASMLRTLLILTFLILALIAPVWIPIPAARLLANRPSATRLNEDE
jgi:hypothetical protein